MPAGSKTSSVRLYSPGTVDGRWRRFDASQAAILTQLALRGHTCSPDCFKSSTGQLTPISMPSKRISSTSSGSEARGVDRGRIVHD